MHAVATRAVADRAVLCMQVLWQLGPCMLWLADARHIYFSHKINLEGKF